MTEQGAEVSTQVEWLTELKGKTIKAVRPNHNEDVPSVRLLFKDDSEFELFVRTGVYFEGCLINTLRRAQPIVDIVMVADGDETYIEFAAETFPLLILLAVNKKLAPGNFPFWLEKIHD